MGKCMDGCKEACKKTASQICDASCHKRCTMMTGYSEDSGGGEALKKDYCLGSTDDAKKFGMFFDVRHNTWYRCTPDMTCEAYDISAIAPKEGSACGKNAQCKSTEHFFT